MALRSHIFRFTMKKLLSIFTVLLGISAVAYAQVPDLKVEALVSPSDGCALLINEQVTINVKNVGAAHVTGNVTYGYSVDGGPPVIQFVPGESILAGANKNFTFTTTVDLSTVKTYNFKLWVKVAGDVNISNDTLKNQAVTNLVLPFPYIEDFTSRNVNQNTNVGPGFLITPSGANIYSWYVKSSSFSNSSGPSTDHTPTGATKFLQINGSPGVINNFADYETPCVNLLNNQTPVLSFWYHMFGSHMGKLYIYAKSTQFPNYVLIDSIVGQQQTSRTQAWRRKVIGLTQFAGQYANIRFRAYKTKAGVNDNMAIDDFEILDAFPGQGALTKITAPVPGNCNYSSCDQVQFSFKNVGRDTLYSVTAEYSVDGGSPVQQTFPLSLAPFKSKTLTFTQCADLSAYKTFSISGKVILATDIDTTDNVSNLSITHISPITVPYREPFETFSTANNTSGNHALGWVASTGTNSFSWTIRTGRSATTSTTIGATGPNNDHTRGNSSGKYFHTDGNKGFPGEKATLESSCIDFTNILAPRLKYWYHRFGFDMGDLFVYANIDGGWFPIDSIKGETQSSVLDPWLLRTVIIDTLKGQQARIKFEGTRGNGFATNMAIDDIFIYDLTDVDVGPIRMSKPDTNRYTCYTKNQEFKVTLQNFGALPLDFSVDSVEIKVFTTKNGTPWDTARYVVKDNSFNDGNSPLVSDATSIITFTGIDMSEIGANYGFVVATNMLTNKDTVPGTDTLRPSNIITRRKAGTAFASALTVCEGTGVILSDTSFIGAIRWQNQIGTNWVDMFGITRDSAIHPISPLLAVNKYRAKICDSVYSNVLTVNVTQVPSPTPINDTLCGPGTVQLSANAPAGITRVFWYNDPTTSGVLTFGNNYNRSLNETDTFYIASQKDSCFSAPRIPVIGVIAEFPETGYSAMDTVICNDTTFYINGGANIGLNATYKWSSNDPSADGKTIQTVGVDPKRLNLNTRYFYTVELNSNANCKTVGDTAWITITDSCKVGLKENSTIGNLSVFPNPTNGNVTLQIETDQANQASLQIISMRGEIIFEEPSFNTLGYTKTFDLSSYSKGIYYMKVISDKGSIVKKVVLQ